MFPLFYSLFALFCLLVHCTADEENNNDAEFKTTTVGESNNYLFKDDIQKLACPVEYFSTIKSLHLEKCSSFSKRFVFMIWTTNPITFSPRNQWAVESLFKHNPCVSLSIYSNTLPLDFFRTYQNFGLDIQVVPYSLTDGSFGLRDGVPGQKWIDNFDKWKIQSPYFAVHSSDFLRLVVLYEQGGTYMDMDHINIAPLFVGNTSIVGKNVLGSEVCAGDNRDCLFLGKLVKLNVLDPDRINNPLYPSRDGFHSFKLNENKNHEKKHMRYTPCNGVMINWDKKHPYIKAALVRNDAFYDPQCWGCMGPRLMGKLLLDKIDFELEKQEISFYLPSSSISSYDIKVLAPGLLYPFDYSNMIEVMGTRSSSFESLIDRSKPYGVHFYGKVSTKLAMEANSTMGLMVRENSLFGKLPWSPVVRKRRSKYCHSSSNVVDDIRKKNTQFIKSRKRLLNRIATYPKDLEDFTELAYKTGTALVCHKAWRGIRQMTMRIAISMSLPVIFVDNRALLPTFATHTKSFLELMGIRKLHFQGIPPHTLTFANFLHSSSKPLFVAKNKFVYEWIISVSYHSGIAVHNIAQEEAILLGEAMTSAANGDILLTFLEEDQATYSTALGVPACAVLPMFVDRPAFIKKNSSKPSLQPNVLRIGLLGTSMRLTVKNYYTQIGAACMFRDAEVHVSNLRPNGISKSDGQRWHINRCRSPIVEHGILNSENFQSELTTFDINLYVSWTDAVPNVVLDSLAAGVPVITSDVTSIFDYSPMLKELLVESRIDDPNAIYRRAVKVLAYVKHNREEFEAAILDLFITLREKTFLSWECFLNSTQVDMKCGNKAGECMGIVPV